MNCALWIHQKISTVSGSCLTCFKRARSDANAVKRKVSRPHSFLAECQFSALQASTVRQLLTASSLDLPRQAQVFEKIPEALCFEPTITGAQIVQLPLRFTHASQQQQLVRASASCHTRPPLTSEGRLAAMCQRMECWWIKRARLSEVQSDCPLPEVSIPSCPLRAPQKLFICRLILIVSYVWPQIHILKIKDSLTQPLLHKSQCSLSRNLQLQHWSLLSLNLRQKQQGSRLKLR